MMSGTALIIFLFCWVAVCVFSFINRQVVLGVILSALLILFAIGELVAKLTTNRTITQRFKGFRQGHPVQAWTILGLLALGVLALILHLGC